jgi:hypothetical protein
VIAKVTFSASTQAVDPFGRWARRTWIHPGRWAITGRVDGALCQVPGTVPITGPPGKAKAEMAPRVVATSVEPAGAGALEGGVLVTGGPVVAVAGGARVGAVGAGGAADRRPSLHDGSSVMAAAAISAVTAFTPPWTAG